VRRGVDREWCGLSYNDGEFTILKYQPSAPNLEFLPLTEKGGGRPYFTSCDARLWQSSLRGRLTWTYEHSALL
jgi:hypothetical protein